MSLYTKKAIDRNNFPYYFGLIYKFEIFILTQPIEYNYVAT